MLTGGDIPAVVDCGEDAGQTVLHIDIRPDIRRPSAMTRSIVNSSVGGNLPPVEIDGRRSGVATRGKEEQAMRLMPLDGRQIHSPCDEAGGDEQTGEKHGDRDDQQ
jgi:hypothetical protein